jgi:hypothetical protein
MYCPNNFTTCCGNPRRCTHPSRGRVGTPTPKVDTEMNTTPQAETPVEALTMLLARKSMLTPAEQSALTAAIEAMQRQGEPVAWFPLLGTPFAVDRRLLNEEQAKRNHFQTLDQLARRGGLSPCEARAVVERRDWRSEETRDSFAALIAAGGASR